MTSNNERCTTTNFTFGTGDDIDLSTLKNFDLGSDTNKHLNDYNNEKQKYKRDPFIGKSCEVYQKYTGKEREKIKNKLATCDGYKKKMGEYKKEIFKSMSKGIKNALTKKASSLPKNVKEKRLKKISCYVKLQDAVFRNCNKSLPIQSIIQEFKALYPEQSELAEAYVKNIFYNRKDASEILKKLNEIISIKPSFAESLKNIFNKYDCDSASSIPSHSQQNIARIKHQEELKRRQLHALHTSTYSSSYPSSYSSYPSSYI